MVAYNIFLNFVEILTLTTFVYLYYSLSSRKQFCLLLTSLFLICELCDILRENGIVLMLGYFIISYLFIIYEKKKLYLGDAFILGGYIFFISIYTFIMYYLFRPLLNSEFAILFYILVGTFSKTLLILFTYWLLSHLKYDFNVPNKQYLIVIITEILVLSIFGMIGYAAVNITVSFSSFIVCSLLLIVFFLIIINGIYFNMVYTEKMQYEKQLQKEKYIKQSLRLIQNISYDIDDKKHRIHWILEHIKHLNNDTNPEISKVIEQYQSKNTYQKLVASKNPVFDILISVKINRLQDDNISIKPFFEISQNEKYDDLDFIDVISEILDYVKRHNEITLHIKGQGIYTLVELYSENDFYDYDRCKIESDLIVKKKNIYKDGIYYMKFLLKGTEDDDKYNFDEDYEVYKYGQQVLIFNSIVNIFMFILGLCLHEGLMTLVWMLAFSGLRVNLGGYHCDSPVKCFFTSNIVYLISILTYQYLSNYFLVFLFILFVLLLVMSKYFKYLNKKAKLTMCIEVICLLIPKINMIIVLTLIENIISYLMTAKEKVNS